MSLRFEWDKKKAAGNLRKHGVGFDEACTVFRDRLALIFDEAHSRPDELRAIIIGHSAEGHLLLVSYTEREQGVVRIISSRVATRHEQRDYEENS
jgi:uncharacterized DUF497 family protein